MTQTRAWLLATRPKTLVAGAAPVAVGSALASTDGRFHLALAFLALTVALAMQVGTNLFNDWADGERGTDGGDRLGPPRATANGWLAPRVVLSASLLSFALAAAAGVLIAAQAGWPLLAIGAASIAAGVAYTGGPAPLAYVGLGEPFVIAFFGLVATGGTYFVQAGKPPAHVLAAGAALGLAATALLAVNNLRDRHGDACAGKRTLAVRLGARFARHEHTLCLTGALICTALTAVLAARPIWLVALAATPLAFYEISQIRTAEGAALNARLAGAARFEAVLATLLVTGMVLGGPP